MAMRAATHPPCTYLDDAERCLACPWACKLAHCGIPSRKSVSEAFRVLRAHTIQMTPGLRGQITLFIRNTGVGNGGPPF